PLTAFCVAPRSEFPARGLFGGGEGSRRTILVDGRPVHPKGAHIVAPGQRFTMRDAGGGGFGESTKRPRAKVLADVEEGLVSAGVARDAYGVEM
ncbi:MAG: hydantoinase B/oxoprolinase family protein, partial [Chromatiales bacterium]|nr:hydantoinase B/oxoprolinase family protein [Chromatiales bacterium]